MRSSVKRLKNRHRNQICHIVGSGHSARLIKRSTFADGGPVIALNYAILLVRRLRLATPPYTMQKDQLVVPPEDGEHLLLHPREAGNVLRGYWPRTTWDNQRDLGLRTHDYSVCSAVALAKHMGCSDVRFYGFDSFEGDHRSYKLEDRSFKCIHDQPGTYEGANRRLKGLMQKFSFSGGRDA